mgnify:CR=1 FL=1
MGRIVDSFSTGSTDLVSIVAWPLVLYTKKHPVKGAL